MPQYLVKHALSDPKGFVNFRFAELDSLAKLAGISTPVYDKDQIDEESPFLDVSLPSEAIARSITNRSVIIQGMYECWGKADTLANLASIVARLPPDVMEPYLHQTWCLRVSGFGVTYTPKEQEAIRIHFKEMFSIFKGKVCLKTPQQRFMVLIDIGKEASDRNKPKRVFFVREVFKKDRYVHKYTLKKRAFLGPTSTCAELAFLMANQGLAKAGAVIYDPFVGTGSLAVACAHFGAYTLGSDIDWRILHGQQRGQTKTIFDNFQQYKLPRPELLCCDTSRPLFRPQHREGEREEGEGEGKGGERNEESEGGRQGWKVWPGEGYEFDAIVCDPPYGVRAGARKSGSAKRKVDVIPEKYKDSHIPATQVYEVEQVMVDLLDNAARLLRLEGRLVYLLPTSTDFSNAELPAHPCLELVAVSEQVLRLGFSRRLVTMVKTRAYHPSLRPAPRKKTAEEPSYANVKDKVTNVAIQRKLGQFKSVAADPVSSPPASLDDKATAERVTAGKKKQTKQKLRRRTRRRVVRRKTPRRKTKSKRTL